VIRYSKKIGNLFSFKQNFFDKNDEMLMDLKGLANLYARQPQRKTCKNCGAPLEAGDGSTFSYLSVDYVFCEACSHMNGLHEDTDAYCAAIYADDGGEKYAATYVTADRIAYQKRVQEIYVAKAAFLRDVLQEVGCTPEYLVDFGAGAGHFVEAARQIGFSNAAGYEPSRAMVDFGNAIFGSDVLKHNELGDLGSIIASTKAQVASMIFVLEHVQNPREILEAISINDDIEFFYFSVPVFSPSVIFESAFDNVMPRHLVPYHTHLYTEASIRHFCKEFGFTPIGEWWFGLDMGDLYRSLWVTLTQSQTPHGPLLNYLERQFLPLVDAMQGVLDQARQCTEVHMVVRKT